MVAEEEEEGEKVGALERKLICVHLFLALAPFFSSFGFLLFTILPPPIALH